MRKIPETITDAALIAQLNEITRQIAEKMKKVKVLKDEAQLQDLKKLSMEIDALDQQWKKLAGV